MRNLAASVIFLLLLCGAAPAQNGPSKDSFYFVANTRPPDAYLSLRTDPSSSYGQRIAMMPNGTLLRVLQRRSDGWWYVHMISTGQEGWTLSSEGSRVWISCCQTVQARELIESYIALLSDADHFNSSGQRLTSAAAIIRQDRANYHLFGI